MGIEMQKTEPGIIISGFKTQCSTKCPASWDGRMSFLCALAESSEGLYQCYMNSFAPLYMDCGPIMVGESQCLCDLKMFLEDLYATKVGTSRLPVWYSVQYMEQCTTICLRYDS